MDTITYGVFLVQFYIIKTSILSKLLYLFKPFLIKTLNRVIYGKQNELIMKYIWKCKTRIAWVWWFE